MSSPSLRVTLLRWLLLPLLVLAPLGGFLQYTVSLRPAAEAFDQGLADTVISVASFVRTDAAGAVGFEMSAQTERSIRTDQFDTIYYAVAAPDGRLLAGDAALAEPRFALAAGAWRFFDAEVAAQPVRVGAHGVACGAGVCQVRVAETRTKRDRAQARALEATGLAIALLGLAMAAVIVLAAGRALAPLQALSRELAERSLDDLAPLQTDRGPREVQRVVRALNHLFERLRASAGAQQAFLADAAHQLRTPLAVLKTEAELALAEPHPPELTPKLARLDQAAGRAARLASQLLALARADAGAHAAVPVAPLDLAGLVRDAAAEWVPRALAAGVDLGFALEPAPLQGRAWLLREAIGNLLHNALEYAGRGATVTLRTGRRAHCAWLAVEDDGPGIAAADRDLVFERFRRGRGAGGSGSGLGLAIVRDIVHAHGGSVTLGEGAGGRGLTVHVELPAAGPPAASA